MTSSIRDRTQTAAPSVVVLEAVRRREPQALAAFFEQHFDHVYGLVYRLLGDRHWAEDATQEVFLKLHRAAHTLDPDRDPGAWVTTIAYNVCRDLWRSGAYRLSRQSISIDDPDHGDGAIPSNREDPEGELIAAEREKLVQDAIGRLPESLRAAVVLREYQGFSYEEIASVTGTTPVAARKRYSRALAELGKLLESTIK
ncbi:MAG: RNA polymerase sigma factor [Candidatus Eisenbacteria bacterium]|uniref:RNA polymerase sigma factor n=1 Tax=Eiseniibacteriota bacterium TaxID=2212470 RepID=A0A538TAH0_UNCEI|nr:MAG: RNA polymerase sigma factor [Candidatus Eisenbacteria bacterium]